MKPTSFIPPIAALVAAGVWLGGQRRSISALDTESTLLEKHIAAARAPDAGNDSVRGKASSHPKSAKDKEPMDWKKIAAGMEDMRRGGGMGDIRTMVRLQQRLQTMSREELEAARDEIAALDLPEDARTMLEQMLIGPLVQKDPELALTLFSDRLQDERTGLSWQLSRAMREWAEKDPARASAWLDQQIAAGKFDSKSLNGKSEARNQFEGGMIQVLLGTDPDAASRRLAALPENQRDDVLSHHSLQQLKEEVQPAFARMVREQLPEKEQAKAIARQASQLAGDGYGKVTAFLERIEATPAERAASVRQTAETRILTISQQNKVTAGDIDAMREWAISQTPDSADSVTGTALARVAQGGDKMNFGEVAELAVKYHDASGNDEVLASFLNDGAVRRKENREQARALAEKISDATRREEILKKLK